MLAEERVRACRSWARTGRCRSIPWVVSAADRGSRAAWTLSRARCNNPCKISFAQTWRPVQPPVIILPEPGAVVRFAICNTRDERGDRRQPGGHFWRPLAPEGGDPPKIPGPGDLLAAEEGRTGDRSAALRARAGRWSWGRPGAVAQAGKRRRAGLS